MEIFNWKDLFAFTRREQYGILVLAFIMVFLLLFPVLFSSFYDRPHEVSSDFQVRMDRFRQAIMVLEEEDESVSESFSPYRGSRSSRSRVSRQPEDLQPFVFDPNTLDKEGWQRLGFSLREAEMVMRYRDAGGKFFRNEDVLNLFCVSDADYAVLVSYINIADRRSAPSGRHFSTERFDKTIDLNMADTADLVEVPGIGPFFARRILTYRRILGGFAHPEQLSEVYGMEERYREVITHFTADTNAIKRIDINLAGYNDLNKHPYIDNRLAYQIMEYRRVNGAFNSLNELKKLEEVPKKQYEKITPYLKVHP